MFMFISGGYDAQFVKNVQDFWQGQMFICFTWCSLWNNRHYWNYMIAYVVLLVAGQRRSQYSARKTKLQAVILLPNAFAPRTLGKVKPVIQSKLSWFLLDTIAMWNNYSTVDLLNFLRNLILSKTKMCAKWFDFFHNWFCSMRIISVSLTSIFLVS